MSGLRVWNPQGNLVLDLGDRITRVLGIRTNVAGPGSLDDAQLATGTPWVAEITQTIQLGAQDATTFTISGTTISWSRGTSFVYGVY